MYIYIFFPFFNEKFINFIHKRRLANQSNFTYTILVIYIGNFRNVQRFSGIKILFILQNSFVEKLLQLLVTVINTELFETINFEVLCSEKKEETVQLKIQFYFYYHFFFLFVSSYKSVMSLCILPNPAISNTPM